MKITMLIHPESWFKYNDALNFMPVLMKYADPSDIKICAKPTTGTFCIALSGVDFGTPFKFA